LKGRRTTGKRRFDSRIVKGKRGRRTHRFRCDDWVLSEFEGLSDVKKITESQRGMEIVRRDDSTSKVTNTNHKSTTVIKARFTPDIQDEMRRTIPFSGHKRY